MTDYPDGFGPLRPSDVWDVDVLTALRGRWRYLLLAALLGAGLGWGLGAVATPAYTSRIDVVLQPLDGAPLSPTSRSSAQQASAMNSEAELVGSAAVLRVVSRTLGLHLPVGTSAIGSHAVTNTNVLAIEFTASRPAVAREGARVTAQTFVHLRASAARSVVTAHMRRAEAQVAAATRRLGRTPRLRSQLIGYASELEVFGPPVRELRAIDVEPGAVTSQPSTPSAETLVSARYGVVGGGFGLLLGMFAVVWLSRHERRVHGKSLLAISGCPVFPVLPDAAGHGDELAAADACRYVRIALLASSDRVLAVAPVTPDDGSAENVTRELERCLSRSLPNVVRLGPERAASPERLQLRAELRELAETHDLVLAAAPPVVSAEGEDLAVAAGRVLLTVRDGVTTVRCCRKAIGRLRRLAVTVPGVVVLPGPRGGS